MGEVIDDGYPESPAAAAGRLLCSSLSSFHQSFFSSRFLFSPLFSVFTPQPPFLTILFFIHPLHESESVVHFFFYFIFCATESHFNIIQRLYSGATGGFTLHSLLCCSDRFLLFFVHTKEEVLLSFSRGSDLML